MAATKSGFVFLSEDPHTDCDCKKIIDRLNGETNGED